MTGFEMTEEEFEYTEEMEKRKQEADRKELLEENELLKNSDSLCKLIGEQKLKITDLEEKISVLLSCKNCPENKGGFICVKEYENKCLAQKIQYIKELEKENAELKAQIEKMKNCKNCKNEGDYKEPYRYGTGWCNICKRHKVAKGNFDKWEIKEK